MTYPSIDRLQQTLAKEIFHYAKDAKKAAGRALGTLIEIITFYALKDWGLEDTLRIEKRLMEYKNSPITHNVEYTLHPNKRVFRIIIPRKLPVTTSAIVGVLGKQKSFNLRDFKKVSSALLSSDNVLRNSCLIARNEDSALIALVSNDDDRNLTIEIVEQLEKPFAMVECKRVGVEEGNKKGPQTIEKAKQGAYVAKTVSSLQKFRNHDGVLFGILPLNTGEPLIGKYDELLEKIITTDDKNLYEDFILTVGVVSNHGNWFTSNNPNKELVVLRDAYDWLLFLTDNGIATFIDDLLLHPEKKYIPIKNAFLASYTGKRRSSGGSSNQFTKTLISEEADALLQEYFRVNRKKLARWFNVISPNRSNLDDLREQLKLLADKKRT